MASVSGDCRRALEICRRGAEIAESEQRQECDAAARDSRSKAVSAPPSSELKG